MGTVGPSGAASIAGSLIGIGSGIGGPGAGMLGSGGSGSSGGSGGLGPGSVGGSPGAGGGMVVCVGVVTSPPFSFCPRVAPVVGEGPALYHR
jgi:hypothetical protein